MAGVDVEALQPGRCGVDPSLVGLPPSSKKYHRHLLLAGALKSLDFCLDFAICRSWQCHDKLKLVNKRWKRASMPIAST